MVVFFITTMIGQSFVTYYFTQGFTNVDIFQLIIAPASCFAIASLFLLYKNKLVYMTSVPGVIILANLFYALFQKMTFFKDSDLLQIIITNTKLMGLPFILELILSFIISYMIVSYKSKKI